ncbi:12005_t:CDS:2 [Ambispora gerdemannii]|uniref:12005_t:CDS:1 n=1 Tax=Ambispora gerdemannii TaxID=144530 RepID=A0A9N8VZH8_9GLOM|nr:12005_t:CDS:2 [Ambispora gerdemannii]
MSTPMFFSETLLPEKPSSQEDKDKLEGGPPTRISSANRVRARRNRHQRKKQRTSSPPDYEDFLVFGYEAKAFRDDEMAKKINDGELLIPWRGEDTTENRILLDRYDARNLLDDREQFRKVIYSLSQTEEEIEEEKLCDEERWADLDSEAEEMYDFSEEERDVYIVEEKRKRRRMQEEDREYAYEYSEDKQQQETIEEKSEKQVNAIENSEYTPKFVVPRKMVTPKSERVDEIIERTARFLNTSNDPQIEIVLEAKQANNPSFSFLNKDDPLYPYYKHVRLLLQTGLFAYGNGSDESESSQEDDDEEEAVSELPPQVETSDEKSPQILDQQNITDEVVDSKEGQCVKKENGQILDHHHPNGINTSKPSSGAQPPPKPYGPAVLKITPRLSVPSPEIQLVIDELAAYIAKSGPSIESKIRAQHIDDPKYSFLLPWNEYNPYYKFKIQDERNFLEKVKKEEQQHQNREIEDDNEINKAPEKKLNDDYETPSESEGSLSDS